MIARARFSGLLGVNSDYAAAPIAPPENDSEILGHFAVVLGFRRKDAIPCPASFVRLPMRESVLAGKPIADGEVSDDWS